MNDIPTIGETPAGKKFAVMQAPDGSWRPMGDVTPHDIRAACTDILAAVNASEIAQHVMFLTQQAAQAQQMNRENLDLVSKLNLR